MEKKKYLLFRTVPTMQCNFRCDYCFVDNNRKEQKETMFDLHPVEEWIEAMKLYKDYDVEFYMWGGEPFFLEDTYKLVKEWTSMDHIVNGCRIDTNVFYAEKIAKLCPSSKVKLNCSYHMKYHTLDEEFRKIKLLKELDMVGMVNFVASEYNLNQLKSEYHMSIQDLIEKFGEMGVFVNVAGDFAIANNIQNPRYQEYREFILQFVCEEDWKYLRGEKKAGCQCKAGMEMFTLRHSGKIASCASQKNYGNFFEGTLQPELECTECSIACPSIIQYGFRMDNNFSEKNHLMNYVNRNMQYRQSNRNDFIDFVF